MRPALLLACLALACSTPARESPPAQPEQGATATETETETSAPPPPAHGWVNTFMDEAVLMATSVRIEGPPGLRDHVVLVQDLDHHSYDTVTTEKGLLQTVEVRDDVRYLAPIRVHLDQLTIMAERRIVVLERPGWVPVTIEATGDCFYKRTDSGEEQRGPSLRLVGRPR